MVIKRLLTLGLFAGTFAVTAPGAAYDRDAAAAYGVQWGLSAETGAGPINSAIYDEVGDDCTNFVSQCVIAGGIRFRSQEGSYHIAPDIFVDNDGTDNQKGRIGFGPKPWGFKYPELETGAMTYSIKSSDYYQFSRVIFQTDNLAKSLLHGRHGARAHHSPFSNNHPVWNDARKGDVVGLGSASHYGHMMLLSSLYDEQGKIGTRPAPYGMSIRVSGHDSWRSDTPLSVMKGDWKGVAGTTIFCLPDAPLIRTVRVGSGEPTGPTGMHLIKVAYQDKRPIDISLLPNRTVAGLKDLIVEIDFDTEMQIDPNALPVVELKEDSRPGAPRFLGRFIPWVGAGHELGWKLANGGRTWKGVIRVPNLPAYNGWVSIWVKAKARDGTFNDADNNLAKYVPGSMGIAMFRMDTVKTRGK